MAKYRDICGQHPNIDIIIHLDSTFKTNKSGYPVIIVGYSDLGGTFHVLCIAITSQRRGEDVSWVLDELRVTFLRRLGFAWKPRLVMGDADDAQLNAVESILISFPQVQYIMCFFHVMQKV